MYSFNTSSDSIVSAPAMPKFDDRGISELLNDAAGKDMAHAYSAAFDAVSSEAEFSFHEEDNDIAVPKLDDRGVCELLEEDICTAEPAQVAEPVVEQHQAAFFSTMSDRAFKTVDDLENIVATKLSDIAGSQQELMERIKMNGRFAAGHGGYNAYV
ncbi:hypothetical protein [Halodesulfovibrio spirochaetisodalis]|uniref:Uncharacterized protein n=1 Tax=Halodesulfovibrio spirochaetisodalis TaxID=1560234 RepID=A0A1B7XCY0_9BACT|nr:hypothetical protein [Halodesulfovibrio spirochaetisodalis]OBQ51850.1 hypothetical protein SP90_08405 [Halodesulfovibrio spirochaetisodalis]